MFSYRSFICLLASSAFFALFQFCGHLLARAFGGVRSRVYSYHASIGLAFHLRLLCGVLGRVRLVLVGLWLFWSRQVSLSYLHYNGACQRLYFFYVIFGRVGRYVSASISHAIVVALVARVLARQALLMFYRVGYVACCFVRAFILHYQGQGGQGSGRYLRYVRVGETVVSGRLIRRVRDCCRQSVRFGGLRYRVRVSLGVHYVRGVSSYFQVFVRRGVS